jgi:oligopeptide transport system ATP-binding protein
MKAEDLLAVEDLTKTFPVRGGLLQRVIGEVRAVTRVSFAVRSGETLGIVGESGCGKSTTGRMIIRLIDATSGRIVYRGADVTELRGEALRPFRKKIQMIFQDPYATLNPRLTIGENIGEPLLIHGLARNGRERDDQVRELLGQVGLDPDCLRRYPFEFSGGQRQRVGIARALAVGPELVIADEPVSALDVSLQAQVINLLQELKEKKGLTYLFIAHDLSVVKHISSRIAVMYLGRIVELAGKSGLFSNPLHPYTEALLSAIPIPDPRARRDRVLLQGDVPSPLRPPPGCLFHTRCARVMDVCRVDIPEMRERNPGHQVASHLYGAA